MIFWAVSHTQNGQIFLCVQGMRYWRRVKSLENLSSLLAHVVEFFFRFVSLHGRDLLWLQPKTNWRYEPRLHQNIGLLLQDAHQSLQIVPDNNISIINLTQQLKQILDANNPIIICVQQMENKAQLVDFGPIQHNINQMIIVKISDFSIFRRPMWKKELD